MNRAANVFQPAGKALRRRNERRLRALERSLIAAVEGPALEVLVAEIREKGLVAVLRAHVARRSETK